MVLKTWRNESGYTVVEVLVALVILLVVLCPTIQLVAKILFSSNARDLLVAHQLARTHMEDVLLSAEYSDDIIFEKQSRKTWRIERRFEIMDGLVQINVQVFKEKRRRPVVVLTSLRTMVY